MPSENFLRYSSSVVTQGTHRFYTLTVPSEVLARTCFVTTRDEDPEKGFQRVLNRRRAEEIAAYIDAGLGTIPSSIVLSAQPAAQFRVIGRGKTVEFKPTKHSFLVLDGQHRIWGFSLAQTNLRVPVVIYNGLSRKDESRLFIDINTKQRPVPNELLLDIKKLAEYEDDREKTMSELFDRFNSDSESPLLGLMSPAKKTSSKISRVTFNAALRPILASFGTKGLEEIYSALHSFFASFMQGMHELDLESEIVHPVVFRAVGMLFPEAAQRVKDRFGADYSEDNFTAVLEPVFQKLKPGSIRRPGNSSKDLVAYFHKLLRVDFTI